MSGRSSWTNCRVISTPGPICANSPSLALGRGARGFLGLGGAAARRLREYSRAHVRQYRLPSYQRVFVSLHSCPRLHVGLLSLVSRMACTRFLIHSSDCLRPRSAALRFASVSAVGRFPRLAADSFARVSGDRGRPRLESAMRWIASAGMFHVPKLAPPPGQRLSSLAPATRCAAMCLCSAASRSATCMGPSNTSIIGSSPLRWSLAIQRLTGKWACLPRGERRCPLRRRRRVC